jgi:hypothetical protein
MAGKVKAQHASIASYRSRHVAFAHFRICVKIRAAFKLQGRLRFDEFIGMSGWCASLGVKESFDAFQT